MTDAGTGRGLVYLSAVPMGSYWQRPHFLVQAFLDAGFASVLWVEPYPTRLPQWTDFQRPRLPMPDMGTSALPPQVQCLRVPALPVEPLPGGAGLNQWMLWSGVRAALQRFATAHPRCVLGVGKPSALAEWALGHLPLEHSFFDVLDNYPAFHRGLSQRATAIRFGRLLRATDDVFCSSSALLGMLRPARPDTLKVLNGYASDALAAPSPLGERDCIGYIGTIGRWFDWPLVLEIARALPHVPVVLVGPEFVERPAALPPNIQLVGEVSLGDTAVYLKRFRVGLIPFVLDDLTDKVDPIKYYEYRCMGIPAWSSPFGEMENRHASDGVVHVGSGSPWPSLWEQAGHALPSPAVVERFRRECAWSSRFSPMLQHLRQRAGETLAGPATGALAP